MFEQHEYQKIPAVRPVVVENLIILWWSIPAHFSRLPKSQINSVFVKNRFITLVNLTFVDGLKRIAKSFLHLLIFDFFFGLCFLACFQNFRRMAFAGARKRLVDCCFASLLPQWWLTTLQKLGAQIWQSMENVEVSSPIFANFGQRTAGWCTLHMVEVQIL